jgi:hypothetical protein
LFFIDLSRFHELSSEYDRLIEVGSIQSIYVFVLIFNKKNNVLIFFKLVNTYKLHNFPIALIKLTCSSPLVFFQSTSIVVMLYEWEHIETLIFSFEGKLHVFTHAHIYSTISCIVFFKNNFYLKIYYNIFLIFENYILKSLEIIKKNINITSFKNKPKHNMQ